MNRTMILLTTLLLLGWAGSTARADIVVAEQLLVDLRAEDLSYGTGVTTWVNHGSLGNFTASGQPLVEDLDGMKTVTFDGTCWFNGPASTPGIVGAGTRSMEIWAYNPAIPSEETMLSWAHRGGPNGTNMSFNYGNDNLWGAVGHWGGDTHDMGWWGSNTPAPAANKWWHLVYTYDGTAARVYVNGKEESVRDPIAIDTYAGNIIRVAAQADGTGAGVDSAFNFTGSIALVRIHDGVLSPADILNNFKLGRLKASGPFPANEGMNASTWATLTWIGGGTAASHDVYFGTDFDSVANGTGGTFQSNQTAKYFIVGFAPYPYPEGLVPGTTYYWRIDEVEADGVTKHTGTVWSFLVPPNKAHSPSPVDGQRLVNPDDVSLTWMPGYNSLIHTIFFGDDYDTVANATEGEFSPGTTYTPAGPLEANKTYYWRVDESNPPAQQYFKGDVWSFETIPNIVVTDPNLLGWWTFDEGTGDIALDWSGHGNNGQILGGTQWTTGYDAGALRLLGTDGYVNLPIGSTISTLESTTITTWVNFSNAGSAWQRIFDFGSGATIYMFLCPRTGTAGPLRFAITTNAGDGESILDASSALASGWHHVAVTVNGTNNIVRLYLDGISIGSITTGTLPTDLGATAQNWLGRSQYAADGYFNGSLDDFRIYDYPMTAGEIPKTMRGNPRLAWDPDPGNGQVVDIRGLTALSWSAGDFASEHDVYFGTSEAGIENADTSSPEYLGRQANMSYPLGGLVEFGGGPYYWRIDEINTDSSISTGRVWNFSVADYFVIEDVEDYNDEPPDRVFETWIDGFGGSVNGSIAGYPYPVFADGEHFCETSIVHSGMQSMPMFYDNNMKYSEITKTLSAPNRDWTQSGVKSLLMWYYGHIQSQGSLVEGPAGTYTMTGAGADIWDTEDHFHFAWKTLNAGSAEIIAKVTAPTGANMDAWVKAGVMIRETLDPNSTYAGMFVTNTQGVTFQYRDQTALASTSVQLAGVSERPQWLRLTRNLAGSFIAYHANDVGGAPDSWVQVGTYTVQMNTPCYIGFALTSHQNGVPASAKFSNITATGAISGATWTNQDIGIQSNASERMYVSIKDSSGQKATVYNPDLNAANVTAWTAWGQYGQGIALSEFTAANPSVNLTDVDSISLGFGTFGNTTQPGGSGLMFLDDIRLYRGRCVPQLARPANDYSNNCVVDLPDLEILTDNWLKNNWQVTPVVPSTSGLVGYYRLENNAQDSSGQAHHGTAINTPAYVAGQIGQAMLFNGSTQYVDLGTWDPSAGTNSLTVAVWAKWNGLTSFYQGLVSKRDTWSNADMMWQLEANISTGALGFFREGSGRYPTADDYALPIGEWTHVAGTFDGTTGTIYINGSSTGSYPLALGSDTEAALVIGAVEANGGSPFNGTLDEVRLYNRALSQSEVGSLAGKTAVFDQELRLLLRPMDGNMDTNDDGVINFSDYAGMADSWLDEVLWP